MEELTKMAADDHAYKTSYVSANKRRNILTNTAGTKQSIRTAITISMSNAAFFSRLNRTDKFCPDTVSTIWLLWRRMATKIPMWFAIGRMTRDTPRTWLSRKEGRTGKIKRIKIVSNIQIVPVMVAASTASVDRKKTKIFSIKKKILLISYCLSGSRVW